MIRYTALKRLIMSIIIGIVNGFGESGIVDAFVDGADDIEDFSVTEESSGLWSLGIIWTRTISGQCVAVKNPSEKKKNGNIPTE